MRYFNIIGILIVFTYLGSKLYLVDKFEPEYQMAENSPSHVILNNNWVATDGAGRRLPTSVETGPARSNKYVGIFYFLWHGAYKGAVYDISKLLRANPVHPAYGPKGAFHWWGEPEAGYYKADDPWIIRRNLQMLTNAGIDILFMDVTNRDTYLQTLIKLCAISADMRRQGQKTPYICFVTNSNPKETIADLYNNFYAKNQYPDLWFRWEGKPLILGKQEEIGEPTQRNFFTWRFSWQFTEAKSQPGHWQWFDSTPQDYGWVNDPNKPEEIPVAAASHPIFGVGKSSSNGQQRPLNRYLTTTSTNVGLYFAEQWKRALAVDPSVVFVTGWNEWIAQRFIADTNDRSMVLKSFINHKMQHGETFFQDEYNEEFNRDIEPMKGGYTDNYYYQLVANVRRFKGLNPEETATPSRTMSIDGKFDEWASVKPVFNDLQGDVAHRDWPRYDNKLRLTNITGRNDIIESRTTHDKNSIYFYSKTAKPLTTPNGRNWMLLFIDVDQSKKTGWEGYDIIINRQVSPNGQTSIDRWSKGRWQSIGKANYKAVGNRMEISIPKKVFNFTSIPKFDFHWADNIEKLNDITQFFINGDSAPDRRFNYRYIGR
ncbi:glycoside hydrolase family 71/99 protein [Spirosoma endbachense]|uniref:Uncharacterized protein n=1 Tax=Spirosoma endbachense TaxID=2666025 RepID=A0A6P1W6R2_9BACT|nr:hypothetical protein [Spirosoma endbachense]QHW00605.1 hypothetical protein GJR95_38755 [Spirosoma endbachense]